MIIETSRTILRMLSLQDLDAVAPILASPQVMKYFGKTCQPLSREESAEVIERILRLWKQKGFGRLAVVLKEENKLIGIAGLRDYEGEAELFYFFDEPYWNKGIATEVGKALVRYNFETHNFPRIIALTRPENTATLRVLEKIGFKFEKTDTIIGVFAHVYQVSREDFFSRESAKRD